MIAVILGWVVIIVVAIAAYWVVTNIIIPHVPATFQWIVWIAFGLICLVVLYMFLTGQIKPLQLF